MMAILRNALTVALLLSGTIGALAQAAELPIEGTYGNDAGCAFAAGGETLDDSRFLLRADGLEAYAGACEFVQVLPARTGASVATALCRSEGMYDIRMFAISEPDPENPSLQVFFSDGQLWHEVLPCDAGSAGSQQAD
jgi:hypothetical protein